MGQRHSPFESHQAHVSPLQLDTELEGVGAPAAVGGSITNPWIKVPKN